MSSKEFFLINIDKELTGAREALKSGNNGKARVCSRRAAGQAIAWFLSAYPHERWGADAMNQLSNLKEDESFPKAVRDAAVRLTTKISERFTYPFTNDPIEDAQLIIKHIEMVMERNADCR